MDKKQQLLNHESYLIKEIEHYENKIKEALNNEQSKTTYIESDSSDLEYELKINNESSLLDLKLEKKHIKTCYLATAELADVTIVEFVINILPEDPEFDGVPILEPGVWKEIMAECRIGMVPFSISFFSHQPSRPFAPVSFRNLQVLPIKKPQEMELSKSVLPRLTKPSDAIQTLRSYENAYRSRRTTLANLSDRYGDFVTLESKVDGGYIIKCDEILNLTWLLQNKNSHLTRFQHKMSFDLEYIDESYVKIIRKANKKLENQSIQTDERTQLLSAIIDACLLAKASLESQTESENERIKETPQNEENIMAPPKTIPKKFKKASPRSALVEDSFKKAKTDLNLNKKKNIALNNKNSQPHNKNTDKELIRNENMERDNKKQGKKPSKIKVVSEKDIQTTDATIKSVNVANKKTIQITEDRIIMTGNSNIENKKRKLDATEKIPVKKIKSNIENRKENVNKDSGKPNTDKTDKVTEKQISNTNSVTKNNAKLKPKHNANKEINKNGSNGIEKIQKKVDKQNGPNIDNQKMPTNTQNKEKTGNLHKLNKPGNSQKINQITGLQKENSGNLNKITEEGIVNINKTNKIGNLQIKDKPVSQKMIENTNRGNTKIQNNNTDKGNTPSIKPGDKRKSLGSGGKSKIPQKKPEFKNPLLLKTGTLKPSSLPAKSKLTNIPIVKRP
ncbi:uncharacterized protein LOC123718175 [Pieris brassicae]|uniref:uncharacterized protein LOC123718175 n=1 Tax=Pieris brassicae TaxID=7116 RepID=UPI001E6628A9|nr:uncharacterized protein LOC123718175 [Pieris brassicae]